MVERKRKVAVIQEEGTVVSPILPAPNVVKLTKFKKLGGGSLYLPNRIIKPNQVFTYDKNLIPAVFLNSLQILEEGDEVIEKDKIVNAPAAPTKYVAKKGEDGTYLITNNKTQKVISTGKLSDEEVDQLIKNLNG